MSNSPSPCNHPHNVVGPFPQTLYLGCSIQKFNLNLAWGAEPSTCTVTLVIDPAAHPSHSSYALKTSAIESHLSSSTANTTSSAFTGSEDIDTARSLHKNALKKIQESEQKRQDEDIGNAVDANHADTGKKIWRFKNDNAINRTTRDLGFLADDFGLEANIQRRIDILGSLTHFRFGDTIFNGIIKTWGYNNGFIDVQIQSPTNLVKNTKLIINNYAGTIATTIEGTSMRDGGGQISVPFDSTIAGNFNSTIYQGNIPNLINVFGHAGFENLGHTEDRGVSLGRVYDYVLEMLAANAAKTKFNPYGGIVAKSIRDRVNGNFLDWGSNIISSAGEDVDLNMYNTMPCQIAIDGMARPILDFDIRDVPRPPNGVYINDSSISLLDFIDRCCEPVGLDYYFELLESSNASKTATVKVRVVSRRSQPSLDIIRNEVSNFTEDSYVVESKFGQEFQDAKTRSVVLGGKQQRLYQAGTNNLGFYRHRRVYEPSKNSFIDFNFDTKNNFYRIPDTATYRNLIGQSFYAIGGATVAQLKSKFGNVENSPFNEQQFYTGSYFPLTQYAAGSSTDDIYFTGSEDIIKPYYGKDINGNHRGVSFNTNFGETMFNVNTADLAALFPANDAPNIGGSIDVSETEVRCAMAGIDSWLNYIFEMPVLGKPIGMSTYIYNYLRSKFGGPFASNFFLNALNVFSSDKGKITAFPAVTTASPINLEAYLPYSEALWPALSALHAFFQDIGNENYGKKYMVALPLINSYIDGNNVRRYSYEVCDQAWEEPGNFIDDTIQIGGEVANLLANENGTFGAIVGFDATAEYDAFVEAPESPQSFAKTFISMGRSKNLENWYWPLKHNIPRSDVYYMPYMQQMAAEGAVILPDSATIINPSNPATMSAHNESPPGNSRWKMYTRATIDDVYPQAEYNKKLTVYYGDPHCIITAPSQVMVDSPTQLLKTMMEEILIQKGTFDRNAYAYLLAWSVAENGLRQGGMFLAPPMGNQQNLPIAPRAAVPVFAAIPLKSHASSYGPWVSHPGLGHEDDETLFNGGQQVSQINNLVGEVNFEHRSDAVPWNYGGVPAMDDSILTTLKDNNQYQQVLENGTITLAGVMFRNSSLGGQLVAGGPLLNGLTVSIGSQGMTTTYSMRTYNRKIGFYNKQAAENIQRVNRQAIENRQQVSQAIKDMVRGAEANKTNTYSQSLPKGMSYSPVAVVAGTARPFLHGDSNLTKNKIFDTMGYGPAWHGRPYVKDTTISPSQFFQHKDSVMLYDEQEMTALLTSEYDRRSFMSLDGLLSPISFYPTPYASTYPITLYDRDECEYCDGNGTYTYEEVQPPSEGEESGSSEGTEDLKTSKTITCPFCTTEDDKGQDNISKPAYANPPSIITSDSDSDTDYDAADMIGSPINKFTLNPIVMSKGEFNIDKAKQNGDKCGHSIDVVGFGQEPPTAGGSLRSSTSANIKENYEAGNQRFFGLRGPLMVHGWGYDLDGYPVPNASGEMTYDSENDVSVGKNQTLKADGTYTEPYRTNEFYKGWAQQPGTWPVGPVDLRWDEGAGVWTVGAQYKNVWVTIEIDLVGTQPTRGTMIADEDGPDALPEGKRRLVFVRDAAGTFAAPRGASIYCSYDPDNGFYQPLYNTPVVTSGKLESSNSATIYQAYKRDYDEDNPSEYDATFTNPLALNVNIGSLGLFGYINGQWVLQNVK